MSAALAPDVDAIMTAYHAALEDSWATYERMTAARWRAHQARCERAYGRAFAALVAIGVSPKAAGLDNVRQ